MLVARLLIALLWGLLLARLLIALLWGLLVARLLIALLWRLLRRLLRRLLCLPLVTTEYWWLLIRRSIKLHTAIRTMNAYHVLLYCDFVATVWTFINDSHNSMNLWNESIYY